MPSADSATHEPNAPPPPPRMGLHDACWTEAILSLMRWVPAPVFTHGLPPFTQIGLLESAGKEPIALFGRRTRRGGDRWNYYAVTNNYTPQKLPVFVAGKECARLLGCAELSDGDTADVRGYGAARVTLYTLDDAEHQFRLRA